MKCAPQPASAAAAEATRSKRRRWVRTGASAASLAAAAPVAASLWLAGSSVPPSPQPAAFSDDRPRAFFLGLPPLANIAHRGASRRAPEHSLRALSLALEQGADVLELDLRITSDGQLVVSHDRTLERTAGLDLEIAKTTWPELQRLAGERCPLRLDAVLEGFPAARLNLEMKDALPEVPPALLRAIDRHEAASRVLVASFHAEPLEHFRRLAGRRVATSASARESLRYVARDFWRLPGDARFDALQLPPLGWLGVTTPEFVERAHAQGLAVHYWTIDEEREMRRLAATGADGLMTNRPGRLGRVIESLGRATASGARPARSGPGGGR